MIVLIIPAMVRAEDFACTWSGNAADWDESAEWSSCNGGFPNNGALTFDAIINAGSVDIDLATGDVQIEDLFLNGGAINHTSVTLEVTGTATIGSGASYLLGNQATLLGGTWDGELVTGISTNSFLESSLTNQFVLNTGSQITIANNSDLHISGDIQNNGLITFDTTGTSVDSLEIFGTATLSGSGSVLGTNATLSRIDGVGTLTQEANHTIQGIGLVGAGTLTLLNEGNINANVNGGVLSLDGFGTGTNATSGLMNTGTLQASNGGILDLGNDRLDNSGGVIIAQDGSTVSMSSGLVLEGGALNTVGTGVVTTEVSSNVDWVGVNVTNDAVIRIANNSDLNVDGTIVNNGSILFDTVGTSIDSLEVTGSLLLTGTGQVVLADNANSIDGIGGTLTNDVNHTIEGFGDIGQGNLTLINDGLVDANVSGETLEINLIGNGLNPTVALDNNSALQASNGATLYLNGDRIDNTGGVIQALDGSRVLIDNATSITGGELTSVGTGEIATGTSDSVRLQDLDITAGTRVIVDNNTDLELRGTILNDGEITFTTANGTSIDSVEINDVDGNTATTDVFLNGSGVVTLNGVDHSVDGDGLLENNITIQGNGRIGGGTLEVLNNNLVTANDGGTLVIDTLGIGSTGSTGFVNNGTLRAENGSTLQITNDGIGNANGLIDIADTSTLDLRTSTRINGGQLEIAAGANLVTSTSSTVDIVNVNFNNSGTITIGNNADFNVEGAINNNGTIQMITVGTSIDSLEITGTAQLNGTGRVLLRGNGNSIDGVGGTLTQSAGHTIEGEGFIGQANLTFVNEGLVDANVNGGTLRFDTLGLGNAAAAGVVNSGTIRSSNGALIVVQNDRIDNAGGVIEVLDGSAIELRSATRIENGLLDGAGTGFYSTSISSSVELADVSLGSGARLEIANNSDLELEGTINNAGLITYNGPGTSIDSIEIADLDADASTVDTVLQGGGRIQMVGTDSSIDGSGFLRQASDHTIEGTGRLGLSNMRLQNEGLITSNAGGEIVVDLFGVGTAVSPSLINDGGTLRAENSSTIRITSNRIDNTTNGTMEALDGSAITMDAGGVIDNNVSGDLTGGTYRAVANGNGARLQINGDAITTNSAEIVVSGAGSTFEVRNGTSATFTTLEDSLMNNSADGTLRILDNRDYTTTNSVSNDGTIELGGGTFDTGGTVDNNAGALLFGLGTVADAVANEGTVRATLGNLNLANGVNGGGTVEIESVSSMTIGAASSAGNLIHSGDDLNLNANNIEVSNDYDNANFGTGNSFDRRANVSGSGQINAVAGTSQNLTGDVAATANPDVFTLSLGNVREGATVSADFQVQNDGTGAQLRGAVQNTNAGGFNVAETDFVLGTGASTGNINVSLTGGSTGGAMTGTIDVVNNFDNVADQQITLTNTTVFELAEGSTTTSTIDFGNYRVGSGGASADVDATNLTTSAFGEGLQVNLTNDSTSGVSLTNNSGDGALIGAGDTRANAVSVSHDGTQAGNIGGSFTMDFQSDGTGTSGFTNDVDVGNDATINVIGQGFVTASGQIDTANLNFGTVQVGQVVSQNLVVSNIATGPAGSVEDLNARFGASTDARISGSGTASGVVAGGTGGGLNVMVDTSNVGTVNGSIDVLFSTAGTVNGVSNGLAEIDTNSAAYGVSGQIGANVINQASPQIDTPTIDFGATRVGAATQMAAIGVTNVDLGAPQAALNVAGMTSAGIPVSDNGGTIALLAPGASDNSSLAVNFSSATAGDFTGGNAGSVTLDFQSDANNVGNCAPNCVMDIADGTVTVTGKVYTAAIGQTSTGAVDFGAVRVGDTVADMNIDVTNAASMTALNDTLRGDLSGVSGPFSGPNSVAGIAAGSSDSLAVSLDTSNAGNFSQTGNLAFTSQNPDMADISAGADASIAVSALVFQTAQGQIDTANLNFGTVQVGQTVSQNLQVSNIATGPTGFVEDMNARFGSSNDTRISGSGTVSGIEAGMSGSGLMVSVDTSNAGSINGAIDVQFSSAGTVGGVSNGLAEIDTNSAAYGVTGTIGALVVNAADPVVNNPNISLVARVGDTAPTANVSVTNQVSGGLQAALNASIASDGAPITDNGGSFNLLGPGDTDNTSLSVGLDTSTAGDFSGSTATLSLVSDASNIGNCGSNCQMQLADQQVTVDGMVYAYAEADVTPATLNFGTVRVGDVVAGQAITVGNTGTGALVDQLVESGRTVDAGFNVSGGPIMLDAGETLQLMAGLNTGSAGVYNGEVKLDFLSRNGFLADATLGSESVTLVGTVNNLAAVGLDKVAGDGGLSQVGNTFTLDFGNVVLGDTVSASLDLSNAASGPADFLEGLFSATALAQFDISGFDPFSLAAGAVQSLLVEFNAGMLGAVNESLTFDAMSVFAGLADIDLGTFTINFSANVVNASTNVPEPGLWVLLILAFAATAWRRRAI
ncbi:MAG: choice-of-anchor D domain-containing protein [Pseudomonadota bacterium]